ncbi:hypothetical protein N6H05_19425 [Sphingobium sp. WTD-1]|uniref:hypothetical protein n=1 Tax=Sphingobium sp. WTD-1 TaxID=2979467 RepID=UPI0024DE8B87|nr:hypothetical protein [Sphingobium sp. WTD-1]WIA55181.1 hypothetical protein N6H05_19425 [Sphingobium sp. WTD-1]
MTCIDFSWVNWNAIGTWFFNWQTLITGFMALGAAFVALQPVRKQLALMRAQNNVMVRETIGHMVVTLDAQCDRMREIATKPISDISNDLEYHEQVGPPSGIEQWYSATHSKANGLYRELRALFAQSQDVEAVESSKDALLGAAEKLADAMSDICQPIYATIHVTEYEWTDEQEAAAYAKAKVAETEIEATVAAVSVAFHDLKAAYADQRAVLVRQLRVIDDGLLNGVALKEN